MLLEAQWGRSARLSLPRPWNRDETSVRGTLWGKLSLPHRDDARRWDRFHGRDPQEARNAAVQRTTAFAPLTAAENKDYIRELKLLLGDGHSRRTCVSVCMIGPVYFQSYLLQLSWCKDALGSEAGEEWSSSSPSLSEALVLCLSPTVYLSVLLQKWLLCFALPPSLPLLSLLPCVTAPQQSHLPCLHLSHKQIPSLKTRQNLAILQFIHSFNHKVTFRPALRVLLSLFRVHLQAVKYSCQTLLSTLTPQVLFQLFFKFN